MCFLIKSNSKEDQEKISIKTLEKTHGFFNASEGPKIAGLDGFPPEPFQREVRVEDCRGCYKSADLRDEFAEDWR